MNSLLIIWSGFLRFRHTSSFKTRRSCSVSLLGQPMFKWWSSLSNFRSVSLLHDVIDSWQRVWSFCRNSANRLAINATANYNTSLKVTKSFSFPNIFKIYHFAYSIYLSHATCKHWICIISNMHLDFMQNRWHSFHYCRVIYYQILFTKHYQIWRNIQSYCKLYMPKMNLILNSKTFKGLYEFYTFTSFDFWKKTKYKLQHKFSRIFKIFIETFQLFHEI